MNFSKRILCFCLLALFFTSQVNAQEKVYWDVVAKIKDEGFNRSQVAENLSYLSDVIGPRLSGSPNMRAAQKWVETKMKEIGLSNVVIEPWGDHNVGWDLEYNSIHMIEPDYQMVIGYPFAFTPGTNGKITERAVIAVINTRADLEQYRGKLNNAIVLATPPMPVSPRFVQDAFRHTEESLKNFEEKGTDLLYARHRRGQPGQGNFTPEEITEAEITAFYKSEGVAVVLKASQGSDGTTITTGRAGSRNDRTLQGVQASLPTVNVAAEHYNRIYRIASRGVPVKMEIDIRIKLDTADTQGYNVIGEIPGTDLAHEIVMVGGHFDSWHTGTGANDNGAGSMTALETIRILKAIGLQPRRTIRVGLWSNEEGGLRGSRGYVRNYFGNPRDGKKTDYDNFSVYFNLDNGTGQVRGVHMQGNELVAPIFEAWMKPFHNLRVKTLSAFSNMGSDHLAFDQAGLPGFQFIQDRIDYRARTWHGNMDSYDHILRGDIKINAVVMASFAYHAAMRDEKLPRKTFTAWNPSFGIPQRELFSEPRSLTNAWADVDNDGDLDLFVGFRGQPNRLYRNDNGRFTNIAAQVGIADGITTRSAAWTDYNNDGHMDLYLGFSPNTGRKNILYKNEGEGKRFTNVAPSLGLDLSGNTRQVSWVDYDGDGDVDLFVGFRDIPNVLYRNDGGTFTDVSKSSGIDDPRRTVGAVWFDYDKDGDLDLYVTNMDGDANGLFRNNSGKFTDIAKQLGLDSGGRPLGLRTRGSVRPTLGDYDNDGNIDIFVANYGPNALFKNAGKGTFTNVASELGLAIDSFYDTGTWGDYNNDGLLDLYVNGTVTRGTNYRDFLFHNTGKGFVDVTPANMLALQADHGAHWVDIDQDGDLDLSLTGAAADGMHYILQNTGDNSRKRSLQVIVLDENGHFTLAGSEIRVYDSANRRLLGTGLFDTGSGYNSQNAMPVHFGLGNVETVDIEITTLSGGKRRVARLSNVRSMDYQGKFLTVKVGKNGKILK